MAEIALTTDFRTISCSACHVVFAIPARMDRDLRATHTTFYCPAGHQQWYPHKSEVEQLRDRLAAEKHRAEQAAALARHRLERIAEEQASARRITRRLAATQGVVTRQKNRIAKGRCPCCSRVFKDLATHMQSRHPKWSPDTEVQHTL